MPAAGRVKSRRRLARVGKSWGMLVLLLLLVVFSLKGEHFLSLANFSNILLASVALFFLAAGETFALPAPIVAQADDGTRGRNCAHSNGLAVGRAGKFQRRRGRRHAVHPQADALLQGVADVQGNVYLCASGQVQWLLPDAAARQCDRTSDEGSLGEGGRLGKHYGFSQTAAVGDHVRVADDLGGSHAQGAG